MPAARPALAAESRSVTGKKVSHLRHAGRLPAVVYGHGVASEAVSVDTHEFEQLRKHAGPNTLVDLKVDGGRARPVLVNSVQVHPVSRAPLHADLFVVRMTEELTVDVPIVTVGSSPAVDDLNGTLLLSTESVRVKALPDHLPQSIEVPIETLVDFETAIHVRDLAIPSDVTLLNDPDDLVARVQAPRVEVEAEPEVAEGEAAEGAAAEGGQAAAEGGDAGESAGGSDEQG